MSSVSSHQNGRSGKGIAEQHREHLVSLSAGSGDWDMLKNEWGIKDLIYSPGGIQHAGLRNGKKITADEFGDHPHWVYVIENQENNRQIFVGPQDVKTLFSPERSDQIKELRSQKDEELSRYREIASQLSVLSDVVGFSKKDIQLLKKSSLPKSLGDIHFAEIEKCHSKAKDEFEDRFGRSLDSFFEVVEFLREVGRSIRAGEISFLPEEKADVIQEQLSVIDTGKSLTSVGVDALFEISQELIEISRYLVKQRYSWGAKRSTAVSMLHEPLTPAYQANLWTARWLRDKFSRRTTPGRILDLGSNLSVLHRAAEAIAEGSSASNNFTVVDCEKNEALYNLAPNPEKLHTDITQSGKDGSLQVDHCSDVSILTDDFDVIHASFVLDQLTPQELKNAIYSLEILFQQRDKSNNPQLVIALPEEASIRSSRFHDVLVRAAGYREVYSEPIVTNKLTEEAKKQLEERFGKEYAASIAGAVSKPFHIAIYEKVSDLNIDKLESLPLERFDLRGSHSKKSQARVQSSGQDTLPTVESLKRLDAVSHLVPEDISKPRAERITRKTIENKENYGEFERRLTALIWLRDHIRPSADRKIIDVIQKKWDQEQTGFLSKKEYDFVMRRSVSTRRGKGIKLDRLQENEGLAVLADHLLTMEEQGEKASKRKEWGIRHLLHKENDRRSEEGYESLIDELRPPYIAFRLEIQAAIEDLEKVGEDVSIEALCNEFSCRTDTLYRRSNSWSYLDTLKAKSSLSDEDLATSAGSRRYRSRLTYPGLRAVRAAGTAKKSPHDPQKDAIRATVAGFKEHNRGQVYKPCGTGKTLTAKWISDGIGAKTTLGLFPSISLVGQTYQEWKENSNDDIEFLAVCSDETVLQDDDTPEDLKELGMRVTTDPTEIADFLRKKSDNKKVVFGTYHSSKRISTAQRKKGVSHFDFGFADEAHCIAGYTDTSFNVFLYDSKIKVDKRLFLTATPKVLTDQGQRLAEAKLVDIACMEDEQRFGPVFYDMGFRKAIDLGYLVDYRLIVFVVTGSEVRAMLKNSEFVETEEGISGNIREIGKEIALLKAMKKYGVKNCITFHSSVASAQKFVDYEDTGSMPNIFEAVDPTAKPKGKMWVDHINADTPAIQRKAQLDYLNDLPKGKLGIVSNCRCLGVGINVPNLESVAFVDPKHNEIDIIQSLSRPLRKPTNGHEKDRASIIIPVFIDDQDIDEEDDKAINEHLRKSAYNHIWRMSRAMCAMDQAYRTAIGEVRVRIESEPDEDEDTNVSSVPDIFTPLLPDPKQELTTVVEDDYVQDNDEVLGYEDNEIVDEFEQESGVAPIDLSDYIKVDIDDVEILDDEPEEESVSRISVKEIEKAIKVRLVKTSTFQPDLTIEQVLKWAEEYYEINGKPPNQNSGYVAKSQTLTWSSVHSAIRNGYYGWKWESSLFQFLRKHHPEWYPRTITEEFLLEICDEYYRQEGKPPYEGITGVVAGYENETWQAITSAMRSARRGWQSGQTLPQFLRQHRPEWYNNTLTQDFVLEIADEFYEREEKPPSSEDGYIVGHEDENWGSLTSAMRARLRGWEWEPSLYQFLLRHRPHWYDNRLTQELVLKIADEFYEKEARPPHSRDGVVPGHETLTWSAISSAMANQIRGWKWETTLRKFFLRSRPQWYADNLTPKFVLRVADEYYKTEGRPPNRKSGDIPSAKSETWEGIFSAIREKRRGWEWEPSLYEFLKKHRPYWYENSLTPQFVLSVADEYYKKEGKPPSLNSGILDGHEDQSWGAINAAMAAQCRGWKWEASLSKFLRKHRPQWYQADFTEEYVLGRADRYHERTGRPPMSNTTEQIDDENSVTWRGLNNIMRARLRGWKSDPSLSQFLRKHRPHWYSKKK